MNILTKNKFPLILIFSVFFSSIFLSLYNLGTICSFKTFCTINFPKNNDVEVLILGNSTTKYGLRFFNFDNFESQSANLSFDANNAYFSNAILKKYHSSLPNLKVLVLSIDNLFFLVDSLESRKGDYRDFEERRILPSEFPGLTWKQKILYKLRYSTPVFSSLISSKRFDFFEKYYSSNLSPHNYKPHQGSEKIAIYQKKYFSSNQLQPNLHSLERMISFSCSKNLKILFIRTPFTKEFNEGMNSFWKDTQDIIQNTTIGFFNKHCGSNFNFIDFNSNIHLDHTYFRDPNHLNKKGAFFIHELILNNINEALVDDKKI